MEVSPENNGDGGGYDVRFVGDHPNDVDCCICLLVLREPVQAEECGHRFCKSCVENLKESSNNVLICPEDRSVMNVFRDRGKEREITNYKIFCTNEKKECPWMSELRELQNHLELCEFHTVPCTNSECNELLMRKDLPAHLDAACLYRYTVCIYCVSRYVVKEEEEHLKICCSLPLICDNCNEENIERKHMETHLKDDCPKTLHSCDFENLGCTEMFVRSDLIEHCKKLCPYRNVLCGYCSQNYRVVEEDKHFEICIELPLKCKNCLEDDIPRKEMEFHLQEKCPKTLHACAYESLGCKDKYTFEEMTVHLKEWSHYHLSLAIIKIHNQEEQLNHQSNQIESHCKELDRLSSQMANVMELIGVQSDILEQGASFKASEAIVAQASGPVASPTPPMITTKPDLNSSFLWKIPIIERASPTPPMITTKPDLNSSFLWKIPIIERDIDKANIFAKQVVVAGGYNLMIVCTKQSKSSHVCFLMKLICGSKDEELSWPMRATITFHVLRDQQPKNKVIFLTTNKLISQAFGKPKPGDLAQSAVEIPHFCTHSALKCFISDDTLSLNIEVKAINGSDKAVNHVKLCTPAKFKTLVSL